MASSNSNANPRQPPERARKGNTLMSTCLFDSDKSNYNPYPDLYWYKKNDRTYINDSYESP